MKKLTRERVRADHLGQGFLANLGDHWLRFPFLPEIGQQQQKPRQALFARIEQLIDEIFFDADVAGQQYEMKTSENTGSSRSTAIIADFSRRMTEHSVAATAVAMRNG